MELLSESPPNLFKGIALFTPGGDLVYSADPNKENRWHLHLCVMLRDILGLPEPPHFLVPCYTATVDRWLDHRTGQVQTVAEGSPAVLRYQSLLNQVFGTVNLVWQSTPLKPGVCDPIVLSTYRKQFPQLWEPHDLIVRHPIAAPPIYFRQATPPALPRTSLQPDSSALASAQTIASAELLPPAQGYVFRLFVSGSNTATERILKSLYQFLEQSLNHPYTLKVIDVTQHPEEAELDQISATPTLVRVYPQPIRRLVGYLDSAAQLSSMINLLEE